MLPFMDSELVNVASLCLCFLCASGAVVSPLITLGMIGL